jgi:anti-sigma regulatory factor (Ser/Thr protein kinase)
MELLRRSLRREVDSVRQARKDVRSDLIDAGCPPPHVDAVEYVVGELVSESVEHGVGNLIVLAVDLEPNGTRVEVSDGASLGDFGPDLRRRSVEGIARTSGVTDTSGGRMLWAEID